MTKRLSQALSIFAISTLLLACSGAIGPTEGELKAKPQADHVPASWEITSLNVTAEENLGTKVEPVIAARFEFDAELKQDLYEPTNSSKPLQSEGGMTVRYIDGVRVIEKVNAAGHEERVFGVSRAHKQGEGWRITIELESAPWRYAGEPLSEFGADYVIAGSDEEAALIARVEQEWEEEQQRLAQEEQRRKEEISRKNEAILAYLDSGFAEIEAEQNGSFVNAIAEYTAPGQIDSRFDFPIVFDGTVYTYNAVVRDGTMLLVDPEGGCQVLVVLRTDGEQLQGASKCSLMPGAVQMRATTPEALKEKYREADGQLMAFFKQALSGNPLNFRHRNLTFGGVDTFGVTVTRIDGNTIYLDLTQRGRSAGSAVWYVKYGKVRSRTTSNFWYFLEYKSPETLEGRRYDNRPNRPIGLVLSRS